MKPLVEVALHQKWLIERGMSRCTQDNYRRNLIRLASWLETQDRTLLTATDDDLVRWRAQLNVDTQSVLTYMTAAKSFYSWACLTGRITSNPTTTVPLPRRRNGLPRPIPTNDLITALHSAPKRIRPWLFLAAMCGLRAMEIAGLRRDDIRAGDNGQIVLIIRGKGGRERIVPVNDQVWAELQACGLPTRGAIFPRKDGSRGPNSAKRISNLSNRYLKSVGIQDTLHQLRHWFGTHGYATHRDLRVVQELMGHASPTTTAVYAAFTNTAAVDTVNSLMLELPDKSTPVRELPSGVISIPASQKPRTIQISTKTTDMMKRTYETALRRRRTPAS